MPNIITATDFSDISDKAVNYACQIASEYNASVTVLHSFIIPVAFSDTPLPIMPIDEGRTIAEDRMTKYYQNLKKLYPDLNITSKVLYGEIVDCLQEYSTENETPWLIVLGNNTADETSIWTGSVILNALKHLKFPVVAIPADAIFKPVKKICFACDYKNITDKFPTEQLLSLVTKTNAEIHVLNVGHSDKGIDETTVMETEHLHMYLSELKPQYHFIDNDDIDKSIEVFVESNNMDWLVVAPHKHSFFESLFHKTHTRKLASISHVPLVALHDKE